MYAIIKTKRKCQFERENERKKTVKGLEKKKLCI